MVCIDKNDMYEKEHAKNVLFICFIGIEKQFVEIMPKAFSRIDLDKW